MAYPIIASASNGPTITASQVGETEAVLITWAPVSDATGYRIERSKGWLGGDERYIEVNDSNATQHTDTAVEYDNVYQYRVRAAKDGTEGAWSEPKHVQMSASPGTPDTPTNVSSQENAPGEVTITWQHPEGGDVRTGYHLYRYDWSSGDGDVKIATKGASETSHTDSTVSPETLYSYHLRAYNESGNSLASQTTTITTGVQTPGVPNAPTGLTASEETQGQVDLDWKAPEEGETVTGYKVYRYRWTSGATDSCKTILIATVASDTTSYTDTSPAAEVFYEYHVRAYNDKGRSTISNIVYLTTKASQDDTSGDSGTETANTAPTGLPTITGGTPKVGTALTADTSTISDADGLSNPRYTYQWLRGEDASIQGATGSGYTPGNNDAGHTLRVKVTFTDDGGTEETLTSAATTAVQPASNALAGFTIFEKSGQTQTEVGSPADGDTITLDDPSNGSYAVRANIKTGTTVGSVRLQLTGQKTVDRTENITPYSLYGDQGKNNLNGEPLPTGTYTLTATAYSGKRLAGDQLGTLTVSFTVAAPNSAPTGLPEITGTSQVGQTLTASTSAVKDPDGLDDVEWKYQWLAGGSEISGATGNSLMLNDSHKGRVIKVRVDFEDDAGNEESLTSAATIAVAAAPNRDAAGAPTINGTPEVEQTLTADTSTITDQDGLDSVSYEYQWTAGGADISGGTGSSYQLTSNEQGKNIQVRVTFTDDRGNAESLTSAATDTVAAKPVPLTATFSNVPTSHDGSTGFTFDLTFSENFPLSYRTLRDHAFTEHDDGPVTGAQRKVQGSNQTWTITVEPSGNGAITITLPETTDCAAAGAICTSDGRKLSNSTTITIPVPQYAGPQRLSPKRPPDHRWPPLSA